MERIFTIGVYGTTESIFFNRIIKNNIDLIVDIRSRRGMRGSRFKYANSSYLQQKLAEIGTAYMHVKDLAPTNDIRMLQKKADADNGILKRDRLHMSHDFKHAYKDQILSNFDLNRFIDQIRATGYKNVAFMCVEQCAEACHRMIVAQAVSDILGIGITHM